MLFSIEKSIEEINKEILSKVEFYLPLVLWALLIVLVWALLSRIIYLALLYIAKKIKLNELVDRLGVNFDDTKNEKVKPEEENSKNYKKNKKNKDKKTSFADKVKIDIVIAKSISIFVFLLFFRLAVKYIWINEVELFLSSLIEYLPNLFVRILVLFFGIRFSNFIYDVVYHALYIAWIKTLKIIATRSKLIILFFTFMTAFYYTKIVSEFIINTIFVWFIWMIALAWWLAFWLWWKDIARDILESFKK